MEDRLVSDDGEVSVRVQIVKCVSPGEFYATLNHMDSKYLALDERMRQYYSDPPAGKLGRPRKWELDDPCAIRVDGKWKRGVVIEEPYVENYETSVWKVTVKLVDDVKDVSVPVDSLMALPLDFRRLSDRVVKCCLGGILPVGTSWTDLSIREFDDFVHRSHLYIRKLKNDRFDDVSIMRVELTSPKNIPPKIDHSFISDPESWINMNHQLCEYGFAKVDECIKSSSGSEQVRNLMEDEIVLLADMMKTNIGKLDRGPLPQSSGESKTKWLPADHLKDNFIFGKVTYVGENCDIYIQDISNDMLKTINEEVNRVCEMSKPSSIDWELGDVCLAQFDMDNKWYRGEIIGLNSFDGRHIVRFVDYGNIEYIKRENLRLATIGLTMRPLQVRVCYFDNLMSISPPQWKSLQVELIHRMLVDKICRTELRKLRSGFCGIVRLDLPDNTSALERIVSEGMGQYINPPPDYFENKEAVWFDKDVNDANKRAKRVFWRDCSDLETSYNVLEIPNHVDTFFVEIPTLLTPDRFLLKVFHSTDNELMLQKETFNDLQTALQEEANDLPALNPTDKVQACLSNYEGLWYRAAVLKSASNAITVQYVDYGNIEQKSPEDLKQMKESWHSIPAQAIPCCIYGYKYSEKFPAVDALHVLQRRFSSLTFITAIIKKRRKKNLEVELRNEFGALLYQDFIDTKIFVPR